MTREDPSLRVSSDKETGQTVVSGMGELHLEIVKDRIRREHKVEADLGDLMIAYRETASSSAREQTTLKRRMLDKEHVINVDIEVIASSGTLSGKKPKLTFATYPEARERIEALRPLQIKAIKVDFIFELKLETGII